MREITLAFLGGCLGLLAAAALVLWFSKERS